MTEPGTGSDLQSVKTSAVMDGNHWVINGSKTFISNGQLADLVIVVAKTDPKLGAKGTSLIAVETNTAGFKRGRNLEMIGMKAQDTSELFFDNVRVPADPPSGRRRRHGLHPADAAVAAGAAGHRIQAIAAIEAAMHHTLAYVKERKAFGKAIIDFQNTRFRLAELKTKAHIARVFVDDCIARHLKGELDVATAAMAKYWTTDLQCEVVDQCLQFHGGYGYMLGVPDRAALCRQPGAEDLRRHQRDQKELIGRTL